MSVLRHRDEYDCKNCQWGRHCDDSNPAPFDKFILRGSNGFELRSRTCFLPMITKRSLMLIDLYPHYKRGNLLRSGGVLEQPHVYLQSMNLIAELANETPDDD